MRKILNEAEVIERFTVKLERMSDIAADHGCSRQAIWFCLQRNGVSTPKESKLDVSCSMCGAVIKRTRQQVRDRKHLFCNYGCYYDWLEMGKGLGKDSRYIASRSGTRQARSIVSQHFDLQPGHIVHHEDRDANNNTLSNLRVLSCTGDHVRHHRGFRVPILWDGSRL